MKKLLALIICVLVLTAVISGCSDGASSETNVFEGQGISDGKYSPDLNVLFGDSGDIILAKVTDVSYKAIEGNPWTLVTAAVLKSYKGDLEIDEEVLFYFYGGYIPLRDHIERYNDAARFGELADEEINTKFYHETINGEEAPLKGSEYIFGLTETFDYSVLPQGSLERISMYAQLLRTDEGTYMQKIWDGDKNPEKIYSEEELVSMIS